MKNEALLRRIRKDRQNVRFSDLVRLVKAMGFEEVRQSGSHVFFAHPDGAILNLQEDQGQAKPYQIKQFLAMVDAYGLKL